VSDVNGSSPTTRVTAVAPAGASAEPLPRVPGYEIERELGRGGMGVVYLARDTDADRLVALKVIRTGGGTGDELARFRAEVAAVKRLQHPNIVRVYGAGEHEGKPFLALEYVAGGNLGERLKNGGRLDTHKAAELIATVARAVHAAHRADVVHRDLKPDNVLLTPEDTPKVSDFGTAKRLDVAVRLTMTGTVLGTPSYMAPEQASGRAGEIRPATDVWALGVILYEMLTGKRPFDAEGPVETMMRVVNTEPPPPRTLRPDLPPDLENVVLKCLNKDPHHRYGSAEALAEELDRFLSGTVVHATQVERSERLQRALARVGDDAEFAAWGGTLRWVAWLMLLNGLAAFVWTRGEPPYSTCLYTARYLATTGVMLALMRKRGLLDGLPRGGPLTQLAAVPGLLIEHGRLLLPTTVAERQLWSVWVAFYLACGAISWGSWLQHTGPRPYDDQVVYPYWTVLAGMAFIALGGTFWGRMYVYGGLFLVAGAIFSALLPGSGPLVYGLLWGYVLLKVAAHLDRLTSRATSSPPDADTAVTPP
jgi:predicted Ser/Thr protein kinase